MQQLQNFHPATIDEIRTLIKTSPSKSCPLDPIPTFLLKDCLEELLPAITTIINASLYTALVPISFKKAVVTPLLKKQSLEPDVLGNYRPVSNLSFISKILEKVVAKRLRSHKTSERVCMSPFNQHIVQDTQRRQQLCECRTISWKPLMVENVFFSYSSICQQPSTLSLVIFFWIDFQQTLASLALLYHGYHPISPTEHSQCLFLGSIPIRPTSAMVFHKVLYSVQLYSRIIVPQLHH